MVNKNWGIVDGQQELSYWWQLTRTEVLMTVNWDDVLLMVNQSFCIADGQQELRYCWWSTRTEVLMTVNKNWGIDDG
jgi:hypothetical protein